MSRSVVHYNISPRQKDPEQKDDAKGAVYIIDGTE